ncbi:MAG: hypothetical protein ABW007_06970 [Chitinophagaceae bacterium]
MYEPFVVVTDELLLDFDNWYQVVLGNFPDPFSSDQWKQLSAINEWMDQIPPENSQQTIQEKLKESPFWEQLRTMAKQWLDTLKN